MSTKKKKYLVTTRKQEVLKIQHKSSAFFKYCPKCERQVEMLTLDVITFHTGKSTRELFRLIESHSLHSIETERGHLLVCGNSLEAINRNKLLDK